MSNWCYILICICVYTVPEPPTDLQIDALNSSHIKLTWTASMSPPDVPVMFYSVSIEENGNLTSNTTNNTTYYILSTRSFTYRYNVAAINYIGNSNISNWSSTLLFDGKTDIHILQVFPLVRIQYFILYNLYIELQLVLHHI